MSSTVRLLRLWVRIPPVAWMFVCCECRVLSGRGLCDGLITRPEESYWLWRIVVWSRNVENEKAKARYRAVKIQPQWVVTPGKQTTINEVDCCSNYKPPVVWPSKYIMIIRSISVSILCMDFTSTDATFYDLATDMAV